MNGRVIHVKGGLIVEDSVGGGKITGGNNKGSGGGVWVNGGSLILNGGSITGNTAGFGGGVYVADNGSLSMYRGSIANNSAQEGGGVYIRSGSFKLLNDSTTQIITYNTATASGGGVYLYGDAMEMSDGEIFGNTSSDNGGGVFVSKNATFTMNGGAVRDNRADPSQHSKYGGGIFVDGGTITLSGGSIIENVGIGGGIYVRKNSTFNLSGDPVIKDNFHEGEPSNLTTESLDQRITITGPLTETASIGVESTGNWVITKDLSKFYGHAETFTNDDPNKWVILNADGEACLVRPVTVTFDSDGGSAVEAQYVAPGSKITEPQRPTRTGCIFRDWYLLKNDGTLGTKFDFNTGIVEKDITLKAVWGSDLWTEFQEQIKNADFGATIELNRNMTALQGDAALLIPEGHKIILNLNGKIINRARTATEDSGYVIRVEGILPVKGEGAITGGWTNGNGGGVYVEKGGKFTLEGGAITGNMASSSFNALGGGVYVNDDKFIMSGGKINGNSTDYLGGGVYVSGENGTFTMSGGEIKGNTSAHYGGGVFVEWDGTFVMSGGSVTSNNAKIGGGGVLISQAGKLSMSGGSVAENSAGQDGGGVFIWYDGQFNLSGAPAITGNKGSERNSNVFLLGESKITIVGELSNDKPIGVSMMNSGVFTNGLQGKGGKANFQSDADNRELGVNDAGEAYLSKIYPLWVYGTRVTEQNAGNILGDKTVSYDAAENKLIFTGNPTFSGFTPDAAHPALIYTEDLLRIQAPEGGLTLDGTAYDVYGIYGTSSKPVIIDGNLTVNVKKSAVKTEDDLIVEGSFDAKSSSVWANEAMIDVAGSLSIEGNLTGKSNGKGIVADSVEIYKNVNLEAGGTGIYGKKDVCIYSGEWYVTAGAGNKAIVSDGVIEVSQYMLIITPENGYIEDGNICDSAGVPASEVHMNVSEEALTWKELQTLINDAESGATIFLLNDVTAETNDSALVIPRGKQITINLNGHILDRGLKGSQAKNDGHVIRVEGSLTVNDTSNNSAGVITGGNTSSDGGGVYVADGGAFTLNGGAISDNEAMSHNSVGGGVIVKANGKFTMNGGIINENQSGVQGGGVYVAYPGTFNMNGGTITENKSLTFQGGGVYVIGTFSVSGSPVVMGNRDNNVWLDTLSKITISGELSKDALIGVTTKEEASQFNRFTKDLDGRGSAENFRSDYAQFAIGVYKDGENKGEAYLDKYDYIVTFESLGRTVSEQSVLSGYKAFRPEDPTLEDFWFISWQISDESGKVQDYDFDSPVTENITLTALWCEPWKGLQARIDRAKDGDTIALPENVTAQSYDTALVVPEGKTITLDLARHILSRGLSEAAA